ncbi:uncharacterized protein EURHEDRAFT_416082 [Aspergillus ruber CBS 135680]|uniref:Uncharacterized protein n=1 Tax=Aspergillus ruber (strain CBS 135680) TaxID=1388766 RepID=A0A017S6K9_ASPRC|nr:uncharacterized protein EURHEDRAFT_416082 [Aspergillus ruber CBS 135680]EYE91810.1 hypothetical protein EURHEDRAFT_416082 [Aspergillus ruber CBS 135680]
MPRINANRLSHKAYSMHERCLVLMTWVLDVDLIEEHLDLFARALCHQEKRNKFEPNNLLADDYPEHWVQLDRFYHRSKEYFKTHENGQHPSEGCCLPRDPLNIRNFVTCFVTRKGFDEKHERARLRHSPMPHPDRALATSNHPSGHYSHSHIPSPGSTRLQFSAVDISPTKIPDHTDFTGIPAPTVYQ